MAKPRQRNMKSEQANPLLENMIFAGPGSGKTRVITHRIANLIVNHGVSPSAILAVTFTNNAAREAKERVAKLTSGNPRLSTFHSLGLSIMRKHGSSVIRPGFTRKFTIYDEVAQKAVIKSILRDMRKKRRYQ